MVAQVTENGIELGGLFDKFRVNINDYTEAIEKFSKLKLNKPEFKLENGKADWEAIAEAIGTTDVRAIGYFRTLDNGKGTIDNTSASTEGMAAYLKSTGQAFDFAAIKAGLLNAALNAGIMLAFSLAVKAVAEAWDAYNYTVEESQQNIDEINDKIKDLTQQMDELNSVENKSPYDEQKFDYLQQELDLQERLLEIEQKRYYQNLIGTSFSDNFDKDSLVSKQGAEYNHNNKNNLANLTKRANSYIDDINFYNQAISNAEQEVRKGLLSQEDVNNLIKKRTDLLSDQEGIQDQLLTNMTEYLENEKSAQEALDSGLLTGDDLTKAQEMVTYWHKMYLDSLSILENVQKTSGTYDDTKDRLTLKFSKIDPNDFNTLTDEEKRIALTLEPDANIDFDELKTKIEEKLNNPPIDIDIEVDSSISFGLNSDNVSTTMQGLEKIKSLYTQFAEAKEQLSSDSSTKLSFEIQDIEGIKDSLMDANKQLLVSEEEFSNFETVLADQSSTAQQIQDAFDSLATAYVNNALEQGNYTDETKELIKTQLELQGATAESADAFVEQQVKISEAYKAIQDAGFTAVNIPSEEITKMEQLGIVTAETAEQMKLLAIQEQIKNGVTLNTATDCQNLLALASDAGLTTEVISELIRLMEIYSGLESGVYGQGTEDRAKALTEATNIKNKIQDLILNGSNEIELDFSNVGGGSKSAGSAGKEAGDAYVEAYEKELEKLQTARDRGEITEAEYLSRMKALYEKYFGGISKYQDKYFEEQRKYLEGMESLYNSALSGITKLMGNKIDLYNEEKETVISNLQEEKDAAIDALEAQKKAAEEAYQAQIDAIQEKIDALEKEKKANQDIIDGIQDEIDAIKDAAEQRKRELDLQKAQYELERARNQRTILQYDEKSGMHYVKDDSAERDAKEKVDDANREIQIAELEKQIDYYEKLNDAIDDTIEGYEDQIDAIQKLLDESNKYYDDLIEQTEKSYDAQIKSMEKYYDSLIKSMENQKSKWEELAEVKDIADAYSAVKQVFGELGYTVEDVLNGNEQAFEDFKAKYIGLMNDMNSNTTFAEGLSYASGVAQENLGSFLDSTQKAADGLDSLGEKADAVDGIATSMSNASTSASELSNSTDGLGENLSGISDSLNNIPDSEQFSGLVTQFSNLGEAIQSVADALGIGAEDTVGGLVGALQSLSTFSLGDEENGLVAQFNQLAEAATNVATAIGGGGGGGTDASAGGDGSTSKSPSMGAGANGVESNGSSNSITGALDSLKTKADEVLGEGAEDSEDGEGVIGQFGQLKTAVDDVTSAIGISEEGSDGGSGQEGDESTLTGAITGLKTTTEEVMGESGGEGVLGRFEEFRDVIGEANAHVTGISDGLEAIDGKEVECTITVNIKRNGDLPAGFGAWTGTAMNLESGSYNAKYGKGLVDGTAHVEGTAKVTGDWGVHQGGQALLGELGREIIVRNGRFFTVGENGAEMQNLQPGDIVFNHIQTEELLKDGHISSRGKAYANGTVNKPSVLDRLRAQGYEVQKYEWKDMYGNLISPQQMNEAAKAWMSGTYECLTPMNDFKEKIKETVKVIESANVVNNTMNQQQPINQTFNITMPNVTDSTSANVLMKDLQSISTKKLQYNWKK